MQTLPKPDPPTNEADEIRLAKEDLQFFEPLYNRYYSEVFRYVYRHMSEREDAADITSGVFLKAMSHLKSYTPSSRSFVCWLIRIAANEVAGYYRRLKTQRRYYLSHTGMESLGQEEEFEFAESYFTLRSILETLPEKDFELIDLKYFNSKSIREISEITGKDENSIRVQLYRIRVRLGAMIKSRTVDMSRLLLSLISILLTTI